jgi:hypothetical protein
LLTPGADASPARRSTSDEGSGTTSVGPKTRPVLLSILKMSVSCIQVAFIVEEALVENVQRSMGFALNG